jgi:hypothetical protein
MARVEEAESFKRLMALVANDFDAAQVLKFFLLFAGASGAT